MKSIKEIGSIKNKVVLVRADFNVPLKNNKIEDPFRIVSTLPTIEYLKKKGAKVVLLAHLEAPDKKSPSLLPIAKYLNKKIRTKFCGSSDINKITLEIEKMKGGDVLLIENIRRFSGEKENDASLAKDFASIGDYYVNDAFSVSHRAHMSIVGIPKYLPSFAGFQLEKEVKALGGVYKNKKHPFVFILGGAKFSTKMPLVKKYLKSADCVFLGGALVNSFFKAKGYEVGKSLIDDTDPKILTALMKNKKLCLPVDVIAVNAKGTARVSNVNDVKRDETILDVGPSSVALLSPMLSKAKLILWNGPLGKYESSFGGATKDMLKILAKVKGETIIGGGDTVDLVNEMKIADQFSFVSTGGGATLDFLAHGTLPGIKALK
jgi:3-phosphoglycerate kinase